MKQDRDSLLQKNETLSRELDDLHASFKEVALRKKLDEDAFRRGFKAEKALTDKRLVKQTLKSQDRYRIHRCIQV